MAELDVHRVNLDLFVFMAVDYQYAANGDVNKLSGSIGGLLLRYFALKVRGARAGQRETGVINVSSPAGAITKHT